MKLVPEGSLLDRWQCSHVDTLAVCYLDLLGTNMTDLFIVLQGNPWHAVDKFRPGQIGRYFANGLFKSSKKEHFDILIKISLNFGSWGSTWQYISIGIWHLTGDMLLPGPMLTRIFHYNDVIMAAMASQITSLAIVCSTGYSGADQIKYQSSASLSFVRGIHRWQVNSPHKGPVTRKMFPFDDVIM